MRFASVILAAVLQVVPVCRTLLLGRSADVQRAAVIFSWVAGALAMMGQYDAVSGASAAVTGMVKYVGTTPVGSATNYAAEALGQAFKYRILVSNPGIDVAKNYFDCIPLPPGLTINTNPGAAGYITGIPTMAGTYPVTLLAGNLNFPTPSTLPATIVIYPPNTAPVITNQPASASVLAGETATFTVGVFGSLPLSYQWHRNGAALAGQTGPALVLPAVNSGQAGDYQVMAANSFGVSTSAVARLTVRERFELEVRLTGSSAGSGLFQFTAEGPLHTNYVIWASSDLREWTPLQTNFVVNGYLPFIDLDAGRRPRRFYRVSFGPVGPTP